MKFLAKIKNAWENEQSVSGGNKVQNLLLFLFENLPFNYFTLRTNFEMSSKFWFNNTKKKLEELN